jgi:hypothetical protein
VITPPAQFTHGDPGPLRQPVHQDVWGQRHLTGHEPEPRQRAQLGLPHLRRSDHLSRHGAGQHHTIVQAILVLHHVENPACSGRKGSVLKCA